MTDEEKIRELWDILDSAVENYALRPRAFFLDSVAKITEIVLCWAWIGLSVWITAYLVSELVPGFSEWLRTL